VRYSVQAARFLAEKRIKLLVVACNTASALALESVRAACPGSSIRVVGVIEPGVREALRNTRTGRIGVIGTEATITSQAYTNALKSREPEIQVFTKACPLFVPLAEEGWEDSEIATLTAERYLSGFRELGVDTLILGCTHYPVLKGVIARTLGEEIRLVDSAEAMAVMVCDLLKEQGLSRPVSADDDRSPAHHYYVTDAHERFVKVGSRFLGRDMAGVISVEL
jgi:glutamate racemase